MLSRLRIALLIFLFTGFLASAIAVIYCQHQIRSLFIAMQQRHAELDHYAVEWGQMQLELTTLAEQNRVEAVALTQLQLVTPKREDLIYLKP